MNEDSSTQLEQPTTGTPILGHPHGPTPSPPADLSDQPRLTQRQRLPESIERETGKLPNRNIIASTAGVSNATVDIKFSPQGDEGAGSSPPPPTFNIRRRTIKLTPVSRWKLRSLRTHSMSGCD